MRVMTVQMGNGFYFLYICVAIVYFLVLFFCLRGRKRETIRTVLLVILFINFSLHFIKQFFEPYHSGWPTSLRRSTFENICAVTTLLMPFVFLFKKQNVLHDYMFFIGVCGGLAALFYPTEALNQQPFCFDVLRFYFCHMTILIVPVVAAILGVYRPRFEKFWAIPLLFLAQEAIICINEYILVATGMIDCDFSQLFDRTYRNNSMVFGMNVTFDALKGLFDALVPFFFRTDAFHINGGVDFYFPVLWLIGPAIMFLPPVYLILAAPFWIPDLVKKHRLKKQQAVAVSG